MIKLGYKGIKLGLYGGGRGGLVKLIADTDSCTDRRQEAQGCSTGETSQRRELNIKPANKK